MQYRLILSTFTTSQFSNIENWEVVGINRDFMADIKGTINFKDRVKFNRNVDKTDDALETSGYFMKSNGQLEGPYSQWSLLTLDVLPGQVYEISAYAGQLSPLWIILYDDSVIKYSTDTSSVSQKTEIVKIPEGANKLVVNKRSFSPSEDASIILYEEYVSADAVFINQTNTIKQYIDGKVWGTNSLEDNAVITSKIEDDAVPIEKIGQDLKLITESDITSDGTVTPDYFMKKNGNTEGPYNQWQYISFDVTSLVGKRLKISAVAGQTARLWVIFDSNNDVVSYHSDSSTVGRKTDYLNIKPNYAKVVVNNLSTDSRPVNVFIESSVIDANKVYVNSSESIKQYVDKLSANILKNKVLVCCGDSITYGADMDAEGITQISPIDVYQSTNSGTFNKKTSDFIKSYGYQIAERNNMTFYNAGISGSTMQGISDRKGFSLENGRYTKLPETIDYLTIWFGWNDTAAGTLGTINDSTNDTFYGGYNVVMPYLIDKYPFTKICLIVPFGTDVAHRKAVRELANKWGVACFDMYQGGTPLYYGKEPSVGVDEVIVSANRAKFQANGAHPNYKGHRQIGDMLEHFLRGI